MVRILELIEKIREYGTINEVPIMNESTINEINKIIKENSVNSILEIGTAIGYSTINFACNKNTIITSLERDEKRYNEAVKNVKLSGLNNIKLELIDALNFETNESFDLIIIDASKSQNRKFFEKFERNLNKNGIIIIDNINFHGLVGKSNEIESKNLRALVRKIEEFINYLNSLETYDVKYIKVGDTISVCKKKNI